MSWWVYLGKKKPVKVDLHCEGGTYALGGITTAELNITYNYSPFYYRCLNKAEGLKWLNDKVAQKTIHKLSVAISKLGVKRDKDYWKATPGNAGYALSILLKWAIRHPRAKWVIH